MSLDAHPMAASQPPGEGTQPLDAPRGDGQIPAFSRQPAGECLPDPRGGSGHEPQHGEVRDGRAVACPGTSSCSCACAGSMSDGIRKWWPAAQASATCSTGPSVLGSEKRSVTSAGTSHSGQKISVSTGLTPRQDPTIGCPYVDTEPGPAAEIQLSGAAAALALALTVALALALTVDLALALASVDCGLMAATIPVGAGGRVREIPNCLSRLTRCPPRARPGLTATRGSRGTGPRSRLRPVRRGRARRTPARSRTQRL